MTVYRRQYQPYMGELTPQRWRFWVLGRYALADLLSARGLMAFLMLTMLPVLVQAVFIYLSHSAAARALLGITNLGALALVDANFFVQALSTQCFFGFILAAWVGPNLVAADLVHGALPLYLSRPFSRTEYLLGKAAVLVVLLAAVTAVPGVLLYILNCVLAESGWWLSHLRIALGMLAGSLVWIAVVTSFSLALSAWIKWRFAASATLFGVYFVSSGFGEALAVALRQPWGRIFDVGHLLKIVWAQLFRNPLPNQGVPSAAAWIVLGGICSFSLLVLNRRLRAREVVG